MGEVGRNMSFAKIKGELTSRKGQTVRFGAPQDVHKKQGSAAHGKIIDEVWADERINRSQPHKQSCRKHCWGDYSFCSQLIKWNNPTEDGEHSIRLAYYRRRCGEDWWEFASQMTVTADCKTVRKLLEVTLEKAKWFCNPPVVP